MNKPLLTVAIPTYNRPETLQKTLEALKVENSDSFIVLVSDDSSTDGVEEVVRSHQKVMPNLCYNKNLANLGFSGNVCHLYELATTRYIWFLCDDDAVYPGAIAIIIQALERYEPVVAIFNCTWGDSFGRQLVAGASEDRIYAESTTFVRYDVLMRLTFLSIIVVEKRLPIELIKSNPAYKDNVFFQLTLGLYLLSDKFKLCEVASTIVHRNVGYKYGEFFKFMLIDALKAIYLIPHKFDNRNFIRWSIRNLPSALQLYLSQKIGLFCYTGTPTRSTLKKLMHYYGPYAIGILFFRAACAAIPAPLIRAIYLLKLFSLHGFKGGIAVYRRLVDRAKTDTRKTGFTAYR